MAQVIFSIYLIMMFFKALLVSFALAEADKTETDKKVMCTKEVTGKDCKDAECVEKSAATTTPATDTNEKKDGEGNEDPDTTEKPADDTTEKSRRLSDDSSSSSTDAPEAKTLCSDNMKKCEKEITEKAKCVEVTGCSENDSTEESAPACIFSVKDGCECSNGAVAKGVALALLAAFF